MENKPRSTGNSCLNCCASFFKWFPVLFLWAIIIWSYYAYVVVLCIYSVESLTEKILYIIFYHLVLFIFAWSYLASIYTNPIIPPSQFHLTHEEIEQFIAKPDTEKRQFLESIMQQRQLPIETRGFNGEVRFCEKCYIIKPDRSHHCSACGQCLLKMDHHCPWVNNCVGFHNYKYFIIFLGYGAVYCVYIAATTVQYFIKFWVEGAGNASLFRFNILFVFFVSLLFALCLFGLWGYHIWLTTKNRSTLESFRAPVFAEGPDRYGFHLGKSQNFREVFGDDPKLWFVPLFSSRGDGYSWEKRSNATSYHTIERQ